MQIKYPQQAISIHFLDRYLFLFFFFLLCWVFVAVQAFLQLRCMGFALRWLFLLQHTGSRVSGLQQLQRVGSVVAVSGL